MGGTHGYIPTDTNKTYIAYKLNFQNTNTECPNLGHSVLTLEVVALVLFTLIVTTGNIFYRSSSQDTTHLRRPVGVVNSFRIAPTLSGHRR